MEAFVEPIRLDPGSGQEYQPKILTGDVRQPGRAHGGP